MTYQQSEGQSKLGQRQSEEAVELAMRGCWEEAVAVNQGIIEGTPGDVIACNRLGKALFELGELYRAIEAYSNSLKLEPANAIATKNLARLRERLGVTEESSNDVKQVLQPASESTTEQHVVAEEKKEKSSSEEEEGSSEEDGTLPEGFSLVD